MSGGKGTSSTKVPTTTESTNPLAKYVTGAAEYLTPYAQDPDRPYTAPPDPRQTAGYDYLSNTGANLGGWPTAKQYDAYGNLISGGGTSPAQPGYAQFAAGQSGPQQTADQVVNNSYNRANVFATGLQNLAGVAGANSNLGLTELGNFASGGYDANPYLPAAIAAAQRPVQLAYQESTAPTTDARFSGGGRYGSGANDAARVRDETALAGSLGDISTNMSYADFKAAMDRKLAAAGTYGQQFNTGLSTAGNLLGAGGNLIDQSLRTALAGAGLNQTGQVAGLQGLTTGFNTELTTQGQALRDYNNFATGQMIPGNADIQAGTGARDLATSVNREPYDRVNAFLKSISGAGANAAGSSGTSTTPYYSNDIASAISGLSGVASLGKQLGIGDLFGGGAGAGALGSATSSALLGSAAGGASALPLVLAPDIGAAGLGSLAALNAGTSIAPALAAAAAPAAFTIVCTELVRQGRMPNTWRLAGMRQFMAYPAIARRGYWVWATPVVAHLRAKPDSRFSKIIDRTFNWRAEDLAARAGVKGARRLIRGRLVTAAMVLPCLACGLVARRDYWPIVKDVKI